MNTTGSTINTIVLGGLALVLSRLIDNSVVVLENIFRHLENGEDPNDDLDMIVSNIGLTPDLSSIYSSNSGQHTAFAQISLKPEHKLSTFAYMDRVRHKLASDLPDVSTYFQTGGLVDSVVNQGMPAPIDIQVTGNDQHAAEKRSISRVILIAVTTAFPLDAA